ncbi:hypothetical protein E4U41_001895, partial [Claviceps citrina]
MAGHDRSRLPASSESNIAGSSTPEEIRPKPSHDASSGRSHQKQKQKQKPKQKQTGTSPSPAHKDDSAKDSLPKGGSGRRKKGNPKSSGGFLLRNPFSGSNLRSAARGSVRDLFQTSSGKASRSPNPQTPQSSRSTDGQSLQSTSPSGFGLAHDGASVSPQSAAGRSDGSVQRAGGSSSRGSEEPMTRELSCSSEDNAGDVDSTQIVQMALSLGESRRIASRRHVSRATPPRLGPLPDGSPKSSLRRHLQQQRKFSPNGSPKLSQQQAPSSRLPSSGRLDNPLQAGGFENAHDAHYRYQFSPSTLARAAKAKEHLELMAQYRRLLDVLPPLKAGVGTRPNTTPPDSPVANKSFRYGHGDTLPLGRQYNPLQYIRNRKVRARERKVIDGEKQGFGDVDLVKPWVDRVVERATSFATNPDDQDDCLLPRYPYADDPDAQASVDHLSSRATTRVRRPRVDWFVEPCNVIADAYWLEQGNHKELIEDRHWRKIFPPAITLSRPMSRDTDVGLDAIPSFSMQDDDDDDDDDNDNDDTSNKQTSGISKGDTGLSHSNSAKDRAKQTLHNIRAFPHRHHGQNMHSDFMWRRKDSATSDISGSETDTWTRSGTEPGQPLVSPGGLRTPEGNPFPLPSSRSLPSSRFHSRRGSLVDASDSDRRPGTGTAALASLVRYVPGTKSLDVPEGSRKDFLGKDYSLPTSPELRATRNSTEVVAGAHLPPPSWSRSESPHRNPISKIKQIIRDKGSNAVEQTGAPEKLDWPERHHPGAGVERVHSEPARTHDRNGSTVLRPDEATGLRGIFKPGTVLRGGVSRLGDMLWKREGVSEVSPDIEMTDESDNEKAYGQPKQFLDVMPQFHHVHGAKHQHSSSANASQVDVAAPRITRHGRHQSGQFDVLREKPRIDARSASTSALVETRGRGIDGSGASDSESRQGKGTGTGTGAPAPDGVGDSGKPPTGQVSGGGGEDHVGSFRSRHWPVANRGTPTESTHLTRREIARMRALVLSTGVKAMEISRRAQEAQRPFCRDGLSPGAEAEAATAAASTSLGCANLNWADIAKLCPEAPGRRGRGQGQGQGQDHVQVAFYELYALAGR